MPAHHDEGDDLLQRVLALSVTDTAFRTRLLADPEAAILDAFSVRVPGGVRVCFVEKPAELDALIVLPDAARPGGELDDDDLDLVAGGTNGCATTTSW